MQDILKIKKFSKDIEFLENGLKTNRNPKPVGQHSIDVANILLNLNYDADIIRAGLFHDLVEDTDVITADIKNSYGDRIAHLVDAMTYDVPGYVYEDKYDRFTKCIDKLIEIGKDALILDAADFISNSPYYKLANTQELKDYLFKKYNYFMEKAKPIIGNEKIWKSVEQAYLNDVKDLLKP